MLHHLGDYVDPNSDCAGLSKDPLFETKFNQNWTKRVCRVWVNRAAQARQTLPVFPHEQTSAASVGMSQNVPISDIDRAKLL